MSCRSHSSHESFCFWCWICWYQTSVTNFCLLFNLSQQWRFLALSLLMRAPFINDVGCSLKKLTKGYIRVVQSLWYVWLFSTPWTAECQASLSFSISQSLLKLMSIESVMPSIHFILCYPLLLLSIFPSLGSFPMNWLFSSGGQNIGASTITSVLPMNIQDWFPLGLTGLMSLQSKGLLSVFYNTIVQKFTSWWVPPSRKANMIINFLNIYAVSSLIPSFQQWNLG